MYLTASCKVSASSFPSFVFMFFARWTRSTWSILVLAANSLQLYLALDTVLYSLAERRELTDLEKAPNFSGTVLANSARSMTDRVVPWPLQRAAQVDTKSSTMTFPRSRVGMEVLAESLLTQLV